MAIQVRRGNEADFDASKMLPGEWAVSLDTRYVRMCFAPGLVLRMSTYESFEADMAQIQAILTECRSIQSAVQRIQAEVNAKASLTIEYSNSAKESADRAYSEAERAKTYANNASAVANVQIGTSDTAGLLRGGDIHVDESGALKMITETTETTMPNSYNGRLLVEGIGGVTEQDTTAGKNLLDCSGLTETTSNGVTFTPVYAENGALEYVNVNGTATADTYYRISTKNSLSVGKYIANGSENGGTATYKLIFYNAPTSFLQTSTPVTFELTSAISNQPVDINVSSGATLTNVKFYPMIHKADVADATYEPFTNGASPNPSYPQEIKKSVVSEIKTRKNNMFDVSKFKTNQYINGDGSVSNNGAWGASDYMLAKVPSVTFSHKDSVWLQLVIAEYDSKKNFIRTTSKQGFLSTVTQELSENTSYIRISYSIDVGNGVITREEVMVNEGTTALPYEHYTESVITLSQPIDLYGIGDVQDVIEDGKVKRKFGAKVFNGSESWGLDSASGRMYTFAYQGKWKGSPSNDVVADALCSHYIVKTPNDTYSKKEGFAVSANGGITIYDARFSDVESFKAWLAQNPITIICRLATPTEETLPIADQIALNSLATYGGITYLEFDSEIKPAFKGEYGTSKVGGYTLEGMLAGRNGELMGKDYANRITALEATVVNNI